MSLQPGTYRLGPPRSTLAVRTGRGGAAAKAGHDLLIVVTAWEATIDVAEKTAMQLTADPTSLRVRTGVGGMQSLGEDDIANIHQTIDDEVLEHQRVVFRSSAVDGDGAALDVRGDLTLAGETHPIGFSLRVNGDGSLLARAVVTQTDWGMKPYSTLFGALKVADDVEVVLDGHV